MKHFFCILAGLLISIQTLAFTGANGSGGGMGVVCRNTDGTLKSVELLDLWEARVIYSLNPIPSLLPIADQIEEALKKLKNSIYAAEMCVGVGSGNNYCDGVNGPEAFYQMLKFETDRFLASNLSQIHRLRGVALQKTDDAFEVVAPNDCKIEQVVRYKDTAKGGDILINQDLVDHMDKTNEAALYVHEAYYAVLRSYNEKSSLRVRRAIGLAFNGHTFQTLESFLPKEYYECSSDGGPDYNRIIVYTPVSGICAGTGVTFQVVNLAGLQMIDYEEPSVCQKSSFDDVFNGRYPIQSLTPFGSRIGFDYSVSVSIGSTGPKQVFIRLENAPDQPPSPVTHLNCVLKTIP